MGLERKVYSFRLEPSLMERISEEAKMENRSLGNMVETILKQHLKENSPGRIRKK